MKKQTFLQSIILILISAWLFITMAVDFIAVPTVFRNVTNIQQAGAVGLKVFSLVNIIELITGAILLILFFVSKSKSRLLLVGFISCFVLAGFYNFYLTPKIKSLTHELRSKTYEEHGEKYYNTLESEHSTYHDLYVKLDAGKILFLILLLGESVRLISRNEENL